MNPKCSLCNKESYTSKLDRLGILYYLCYECVDKIRVSSLPPTQ